MISRLKKELEKLRLVDRLALALVLGLMIFFGGQFFHSEEMVMVYGVTDSGLYYRSRTPFWYTATIKKGEAEYDSFSRKVAEVVDFQSFVYERQLNEKEKVEEQTAIVKVKLRTKYDKKRKKHIYRGEEIGRGKKLTLHLSETELEMVVMSIGEDNFYENTGEGIYKLKAKGMLPEVDEILKPGSQVMGLDGTVFAEVLDKRSEWADILGINWQGQGVKAKDPLSRDIYLTVKIKYFEEGENRYFYYDQQLKAGEFIFLPFKEANVNALVLGKVSD